MTASMPLDLPLAHCCIWVVEDVAALRLLAERSLQGAGAEVVLAADLAEALALRSTAPVPDLVCLDLDLPDGDGLMLAPVFGAATCFAYTASTDRQTQRRCLSAGLAGIIDKTAPGALVPQVVAALRERGVIAERALRLHRPAVEAVDDLQRRYLRFLSEQRLALLDEFLERAGPLDLERVRGIAHRLSGTAVHFCLAEIGRVARRLLSALREQDGRAAQAVFERLEEAIAEALEAHHLAEFARRNDGAGTGIHPDRG